MAVRVLVRAIVIEKKQSQFSCFPRRSFPRATLALKSLSLLWLVLLSTTVGFGQNAGGTASQLLAVEGSVEVVATGKATWSVGAPGQVLRNGDRVRTGARSRATIRLSDRSVLAMKELTTLEIQPPSSPGATSSFELKTGGSYFFNRERPGTVEFRTPVASGAIRGTEFHLLVAEGGRTEVALFDGAVELTNNFGGTRMASGDQAVVDPGQSPRKVAAIEASGIIQWMLYYPAIIDPAEIDLSRAETTALKDSLAAYGSGDLLRALNTYPADRVPASEAEKLFRASTLLAVGQVVEAMQLVQVTSSPLSDALRQMVETVRGRPLSRGAAITRASEWMAESYALQAQSKLEAALLAARRAVAASPKFGFAWVRVAELEFSFGNANQARSALARGLALAPRHAQAHALNGFVHAAESKFMAAEKAFDHAIALDPALGNGWLGRGLMRVRAGRGEDGRQDLQVAATREPRRALLRSYLGKAWSYTHEAERAGKEFSLARKFDPSDPTPWLYSAILAEQQNRVNEAVSDLERSKELNDNRSVYRSRLLLDQDKAIRSANLARIYRDAGMTDWSLREGARAVSYDYANFSAHQFLAQSYTALRDPKRINLRYESPGVSEYFVANLLSPVGATPLSQSLADQEYTRLFDRDHFGVASSTEYFSRGDWVQEGSQYGRYGNMDYSLDASYRSERGQRANNDLERTEFAGRFRQQLTSQDTVYFEAQRTESESGDLAQYHSQSDSSRTFRAREVQEPNLFLGYHREWNPGVHTLFLGARFDDTLHLRDPAYPIYFFRYVNGSVVSNRSSTVRDSMRFRSDLEAYSTELQQIFSGPFNTLILGGRFQYGLSDTFNSVTNAGQIDFRTENRTELMRQSLYAYDQWSPWQPLQFTVGVAYDRLHYPDNIDTAPISSGESSKDRISPKAGVIWAVDENTHVRGAYTRSLGGVFFDHSFRLEPTQVGGFNQNFRSAAPESAVGQVPGTRFETYGVGMDHRFPTRTYLNLDAEVLNSKATRIVGVITNSTFIPVPDSASSARQRVDYEERSLTISVNQLVGTDWAFGIRYRLSEAELHTRFPVITDSVNRTKRFNQDEEAILQQLSLSAICNLPCGLFSQGEALWTAQNHQGARPGLEHENFWQLNAFVGYRFLRRHAEARVGLLNITDQDYRLSPVNLHTELPRDRTFYASFKFYF